MSPDGRSVYVVGGNYGNNISQFDVGAGGVLSPKSPATVPGGSGPLKIAVSPAPRVPTTIGRCKGSGWMQFGFKTQGRCIVFVVLTQICEAFERHGRHLKFCPPAPPALRPS